MTELNQIYKCPICGNIVEIVGKAGGTLVCCGKPMLLLEANSVDAAVEKHVPVVEKKGSEVFVKVGEVQHPMTEEHYIQWIEVITANKVYKKFLKPNEKPEATFIIDEDIVLVREYCNLHGLWKK
ncbi:desulfoferrodoxin [Clostridium akagii]|uniref:desulfoferrodoxin n=1 Tax=Clostridium akagii TaxID=91623 RepID=UPI00047A64D1|nr:desulfoferrodoxin [Clostridium akagii]